MTDFLPSRLPGAPGGQPPRMPANRKIADERGTDGQPLDNPPLWTLGRGGAPAPSVPAARAGRRHSCRGSRGGSRPDSRRHSSWNRRERPTPRRPSAVPGGLGGVRGAGRAPAWRGADGCDGPHSGARRRRTTRSRGAGGVGKRRPVFRNPEGACAASSHCVPVPVGARVRGGASAGGCRRGVRSRPRTPWGRGGRRSVSCCRATGRNGGCQAAHNGSKPLGRGTARGLCVV